MQMTRLVCAATVAAALVAATAAEGGHFLSRPQRGRLRLLEGSKGSKSTSKSKSKDAGPHVPPVPGSAPSTPFPTPPEDEDDDRFAPSKSDKSTKSENLKSEKSPEFLQSAKSAKSKSFKSAKSSKSAKSTSSKGGKSTKAPGVCQQHMSTVADVMACMEDALQGTQPEGVDLLNLTAFSVNRCIYMSTSPGTLSVTNKTWNQTDEFQTDMYTHELNNGLHDGVVEEGSLQGHGYAFAWLQGNDQIARTIRNMALSNVGPNVTEDEVVKEWLVKRNTELAGMDPEGGVTSIYILDACKISHVDDRNGAAPAYTVGIAPTVPNLVRYIEAEFLRKYEQRSFSWETVAALTPTLSTPEENYENATGCPNGSSALDLAIVCDDPGANATAAAVRPYSHAGASAGNTSRCVETYLGLGSDTWDTPGGLRVALEACFDVSPYRSLNGMGWYPNPTRRGSWTTPEWFLPNTESIHELRHKAHLETLYASCDNDVYSNVTQCQLLPLHNGSNHASRASSATYSKTAKSSLAPGELVQPLNITQSSTDQL